MLPRTLAHLNGMSGLVTAIPPSVVARKWHVTMPRMALYLCGNAAKEGHRIFSWCSAHLAATIRSSEYPPSLQACRKYPFPLAVEANAGYAGCYCSECSFLNSAIGLLDTLRVGLQHTVTFHQPGHLAWYKPLNEPGHLAWDKPLNESTRTPDLLRAWLNQPGRQHG